MGCPVKASSQQLINLLISNPLKPYCSNMLSNDMLITYDARKKT